MKGRNDNLDELARAWLQAKAREAAANAERIEIENQMLGMLEVKTEGSTTTTLDDFKIVVTTKMSRALEKGGAEAIKGLVPEEYWPLKTKVELDAKGLEWLRENRPAYYQSVARYVTTKPAKPGVQVTRIEKVEAA